jgi:hypothetical protein
MALAGGEARGKHPDETSRARGTAQRRSQQGVCAKAGNQYHESEKTKKLTFIKLAPMGKSKIGRTVGNGKTRGGDEVHAVGYANNGPGVDHKFLSIATTET